MALKQVVQQLLQKLHHVTQYAKLQKQLLLACLVLLDDLQRAAPDKAPIKVGSIPKSPLDSAQAFGLA